MKRVVGEDAWGRVVDRKEVNSVRVDGALAFFQGPCGRREEHSSVTVVGLGLVWALDKVGKSEVFSIGLAPKVLVTGQAGVKLEEGASGVVVSFDDTKDRGSASGVFSSCGDPLPMIKWVESGSKFLEDTSTRLRLMGRVLPLGGSSCSINGLLLPSHHSSSEDKMPSSSDLKYSYMVFLHA